MINIKVEKGYLLMAAIFIFLLSSSSIATAQQRYSNISLASSLAPTANSSWLSRSGVFAFGFYSEADGFRVGIFVTGNSQQTVVWTANRDDPPVSSNTSLVFTSDGLILQLTLGQQITITSSIQSASSASMLDSGNFVLYNSNHEIIWQSFEHPTDTLLPGQRLAGQALFSSVSETNHSTGKFRLTMQQDGNLVQYPIRGPITVQSAYWATGTNGRGDNVSLNLDGDGHLYLLNATSFNILNLTNGGYPAQETIYRLKIDVDGISRLYYAPAGSQWSIIWSSSNDRCNPKGFCGLNSYCVLMDQEAVCRCLSGFDFVDTSQQNSDCERNFTAESCKNKNGSTKYDIKALDSVKWDDDDSYSIISLTTEENCKEACLGDCNCEAALFKDRECRKQKLPLRYGRRSQSDSTITFVKVGEPATRPTTGSPYKESKKYLRKDILTISVSLVALSFVVFAISGVLVYRNHVWAYKKISEKGNVELSEDFGPRAFTYAELEQVTNGFKEEVGRGSFGTVYKGTLSENQKVVAVKRLDKVLAEGEREFQTEMRVIGKTHHRNLVRLLGYCHDGPKRLLVYEYMRNGSLADILFTPEKQSSWDERIGIALDIARGILYLHEECETQIIHCDIKPQNILMDEYRRAKIADFGLAKLLKPDQTNTFTGIRGTRGFVAPEWHRKLPVTVKADVYSFGIVLLEIICCRRSVEWSLPEDEAVLEQWVDYCFQAGELGKLVGGEEVDKRKLERMVKVGLWCILDEPSLRPSIKKVLLMLEGTVDIPVPPSLTSFLSAI